MPLSVIVEGQTEESFIEIGDRNPEDINDGVDTAPSRRLTSLVPSYRKPVSYTHLTLPTIYSV